MILPKWFKRKSLGVFFVDNIVLANETWHGVNIKVDIWWDALKSQGFWLSMIKIEYMEFKFIKCRNRDEGIVRLDGYEIPK